MIAATGMDAVGACGDGGRAAGFGIEAAAGLDSGAALGDDAADEGGGAAAAGFGSFAAGAATAGFGSFAAGAAAAPPVAPMSIVHNFCPGFTVSPSLTKNSFITPGPGDGTGTVVCGQARFKCRHSS